MDLHKEDGPAAAGDPHDETHAGARPVKRVEGRSGTVLVCVMVVAAALLWDHTVDEYYGQPWGWLKLIVGLALILGALQVVGWLVERRRTRGE